MSQGGRRKLRCSSTSKPAESIPRPLRASCTSRDNLSLSASFANMSARVSEAYVLQTWPFKEGDLIVSFLARDHGKLRGVARRARRPKSGFGSGLERLSHVRMSYFHRENRELVTIDSCEIVHSQFGLVNDFAAACALDFFAEVSEQLLPAAEPNEKYFRLITAVLEQLRTGNAGAQAGGSVVRDKQTWRAITYFSVWAVKLAGLLPELHVCLGCGAWLGTGYENPPENPERAWFARGRAGLHCHDCRRALDIRSAWELSPESRAIAEEILRTPIAQLAERPWSQATAADLRRFLAQQMESQIERKLITFPVLEAAA
jgi:DNA repair protein RecO (recombination protein O)